MEHDRAGQHFLFGLEHLKVSDNGLDRRFPNIFENHQVGDQKELVSIKADFLDRDSASYANVDSDISITFGGTNLYYKPRAILNLVKFMGKVLKVEKPREQ